MYLWCLVFLANVARLDLFDFWLNSLHNNNCLGANLIKRACCVALESDVLPLQCHHSWSSVKMVGIGRHSVCAPWVLVLVSNKVTFFFSTWCVTRKQSYHTLTIYAQVTVTIYVQDLLTIGTHNLSCHVKIYYSRSKLSIYAHGLHSCSGTHYLRSPSAITIWHSMSPLTSYIVATCTN